jgi:hypothetical protein
LIVLLSWNYFSRLWCLYEWACFLVSHPITSGPVSRVSIRLVPVPNLQTHECWLDAVRSVSVAEAKCFSEDDRKILTEKVVQYYAGNTWEECCANFEHFVKVSAIALISLHVAEYMSDPHLLVRWYTPWVDLARSLGFAALADALDELAAKRVPCEWHNERGVTRAIIARRLSLWFSRSIFPIVEETKQRCVRGITLRLFSPFRDSIYSPASAGLRGDSLARKVARRFFRCADVDSDGSLAAHEVTNLRRLIHRFSAEKWTAHNFQDEREQIAEKLEFLFLTVDLDGNSSIQLDEWEMCASAMYETLGRSAFLSLLSQPFSKRRRHSSEDPGKPKCSRGSKALFVMMLDGRVGLP